MNDDIPKGELWKGVVGYEGLYEVSNFGRVRSYFNNRWGKRLSPKTLNERKDDRGYNVLRLNNGEGVYKNMKAHRLVAIAFIPSIKNKLLINHIDGNKLNNNVSNLEWCTHSENQKHAFRTGLRTPVINRGEDSGMSKLTESQVRRIKLMKEVTPKISNAKIARFFNVTKDAIWLIVHNKTWKHA